MASSPCSPAREARSARSTPCPGTCILPAFWSGSSSPTASCMRRTSAWISTASLPGARPPFTSGRRSGSSRDPSYNRDINLSTNAAGRFQRLSPDRVDWSRHAFVALVVLAAGLTAAAQLAGDRSRLDHLKAVAIQDMRAAVRQDVLTVKAQLSTAANLGVDPDDLWPIRGDLQAVARASRALEHYSALVSDTDPSQVALGVAGVQRYGQRVHEALVNGAPPKMIVISVAGQRLRAYERGKVVEETLVTTGRPELPTDIGPMQVTKKSSPWTMQSPWPKGSPFWYPDTVVQMVLWFTNPGEGIHDDAWEPASAYGPGSTTGPYASHGCIHVTAAAE